MSQSVRRSAYIFLCAFLFIAVVFVSVRPLRIAGVFQALGVFLFTAVAIAAWLSGPRKVDLKAAGRGKQALAGIVLIAPSAIVSLLWVGIGPPFQATPSENYMRFLVLVWNSVLVTIGFVLMEDVLKDAGERVCSTIGLATALIAGTAYLVCLTLSLAQTALTVQGNRTQPPAIIVDFYSAIEFVACLMTYVTTAAFATGMGRVRLLGRTAAGAYISVAALLGLLIIVRGLAYPEISAHTAPWYTRPGVIAGIPAIPWLMPYLLGAVLLRRTRVD